jgi:hypothetical protein
MQPIYWNIQTVQVFLAPMFCKIVIVFVVTRSVKIKWKCNWPKGNIADHTSRRQSSHGAQWSGAHKSWRFLWCFCQLLLLSTVIVRIRSPDIHWKLHRFWDMNLFSAFQSVVMLGWLVQLPAFTVIRLCFQCTDSLTGRQFCDSNC